MKFELSLFYNVILLNMLIHNLNFNLMGLVRLIYYYSDCIKLIYIFNIFGLQFN